MMRCLHAYLPKPKEETNSSKSASRFTQVYGLKFGKYAEDRGYLTWVKDGHGYEQRLMKKDGLGVLCEWLNQKVIRKKEPLFGWKGVYMTLGEVVTVCGKAVKDWQDGWLD